MTPPLLSSDDIFNTFLIDPEMCPCGITTRLLEASLAVQQFVQQCFLGRPPASRLTRQPIRAGTSGPG